MGDVNRKYNVAMDSVSYGVGYNLNPVRIASICSQLSEL